MKKRLLLIISLVIGVLLLSGCEKEKFSECTVNTEENEKLGFKISTKYNFKVEKESEEIVKIYYKEVEALIAEIVSSKEYDHHLSVIKEDGNKLDEGKKDNISYMFYEVDGVYEYIIKIEDETTGVILRNFISEDAAKDAFSRLTFTYEKVDENKEEEKDEEQEENKTTSSKTKKTKTTTTTKKVK